MNEFRITLEDRPGSMAECGEAIGEAGINSSAGAGLAASTAVAALVTDDADGTAAALDGIGVTYTMRRLEIAVLQHTPGSLGVFARSLAENSINLGSLYIIKSDDEGVHIGYSIN